MTIYPHAPLSPLFTQPRAATVPQSQFAEAAKGINAGITSVATKLQDLTKRAFSSHVFKFSSSSLFRFP
jgi:hypothetical protein